MKFAITYELRVVPAPVLPLEDEPVLAVKNREEYIATVESLNVKGDACRAAR